MILTQRSCVSELTTPAFHIKHKQFIKLLLLLFLLLRIYSDKETIEQLHVQLHELNEISHNLKLEMEAYDRLVKQFGIDRFNEDNKKIDNDKSDKALLTALLEEIRDLRQQLTISMDANIALKEKLEKELGRPVSISPLMDTTNLTTTAATTPFKDPTMSAKRSLFSAVLHSVSIADARHGDDDNAVGTTRQNKKKGSVHFSPFETPTRDYGKNCTLHLFLHLSFKLTSLSRN